MDKETRLLIVGLGMPLVLAIAGWVNSHKKVVEAKKETVSMSDSFQDYVEYVMVQRGCEP